ncbi:hypothetical protein ACH5RR_022362 [Cinchona calisaya]|uniref:Uncharacterized protein n=1 Tax=Cinchona calisaya TaxID=153742 RepID=A0ABD2ZAZ6_9GENT
MRETLESLQALHVCQCKGEELGIYKVPNNAKVQYLFNFLVKLSENSNLSHMQLGENGVGGAGEFGNLYCGKRGEACVVTVKIWDTRCSNFARRMDKLSKLTDEFYLLRHPSVNGHQLNLAKPIGYFRKFCSPGIVYNLNPRDTLHNPILDVDYDLVVLQGSSSPKLRQASLKSELAAEHTRRNLISDYKELSCKIRNLKIVEVADRLAKKVCSRNVLDDVG